MKAEKDNVISIVYTLRDGSKNGKIVESLTKENPLTFIFGSGGLLPKFEENISGLKAGERFEFLLHSEDAYGPVVENAIVHVPKKVFEIDGSADETLLQIGNTIPMIDADGRRLNGKVIEIEEQAVKMDFNHPMAGRDLFFAGEVTDIRRATEEELSHGHVHGNDSGCSDDSCGCGSHGCDC